MAGRRPFSAHVLWPWIIAPGIVVVDFILVAVQVRIGLAGTWGACLSLAMPVIVAGIIFIPRIRKAPTVPWEPMPFPYNPASLLTAVLMTIVRYAGGCFVFIGLCLGAAAFFAPSILLSIATITTDPSPMLLFGLLGTVLLVLWYTGGANTGGNRDFQRGTSLQNIADARDSAEERMKKWEESDAP